MRVYADTSVFGGVFDTKFSEASKLFFEMIRNHEFELIISPIVDGELIKAPAHVHQLYSEIMLYATLIKVTPEATKLQKAYLKAQVVSPQSEFDALHVALASVNACEMIVSWNFKHIVNFRRIPLYNAINKLQGYREINIFSPPEVVYDQEK